MDDTGSIGYRFARQRDEAAIAALHADSWRRTFRSLLPDRYLDEDITAERAEAWRRRFADPAREVGTVTIVAEQDGDLVGFVHSVIDDDPEWGTLLDNLHVRHDVQGRGIARRLIGETAAALRERGRQRVYLWALEANERARHLYGALAAEAVETSVWEFAGAAIPSFRYAWADTRPAAGMPPGGRRATRAMTWWSVASSGAAFEELPQGAEATVPQRAIAAASTTRLPRTGAYRARSGSRVRRARPSRAPLGQRQQVLGRGLPADPDARSELRRRERAVGRELVDDPGDG